MARREDGALAELSTTPTSRAGGVCAAVAPLFEGARGFLGTPGGRATVRVGRLFERARGLPTRCRSTSVELIDRIRGSAAAGMSRRCRRGAGISPRGHGTASETAVAAELDRLNRAYEAHFGFRYCVFVAGRSRAALLPEMAAALDADRDAELRPGPSTRWSTSRSIAMPGARGNTGRKRRIELGANRYGKAAIRLVRVARGPTATLRDLTVAIALEGDFEAAHTDGDNANVVATDTMRNTAYAFARDPRRRARGLWPCARRHFLAPPQVDRATVNIARTPGARSSTGRPAPDAFVRGGEGTRVATVTATGGGTTVEAGVEDLIVMKTTTSAFSGFPRDRYTTLPETDDRLMATKLTAIWGYGAPDLDHDATLAAVRATLLEVFADHDSPCVQASIWIMAKAILERHEEVDEVRMVLPNLHHWLVDLSPFGLENDREIYRRRASRTASSRRPSAAAKADDDATARHRAPARSVSRAPTAS